MTLQIYEDKELQSKYVSTAAFYFRFQLDQCWIRNAATAK
jgi:hypothetical protein